MKIECPGCHSWFKLEASKVSPEGSKARCSKCQTIFTIYPDLSEEELTGDFSSIEDHPDFPEDPLKEKGFCEQSIIDQDLPGEDSGEEIRGGNKLLIAVLVICLLLLGAAAFYIGYPLLLGLDTPELTAVESRAEPEQVVSLDKKDIEKIALEDVRQYFVENEKAGQIFVIEGKAVNNFDVGKEFVRLRATLYDNNGNVFTVKDFYAGNVISLFQLQILSQDELEAGLNARVDVLNNNINPAANIPFMMVFFNPPENVSEFGLEVIEAKTVEQN